jgi:arginyl-tRNA synthetase
MSVQEKVQEGLLSAIRRIFDIQLTDLASEVPPRTELGDLAYPVAFELAKRLKVATGQKQNPREIAMRLSPELGDVPGVSRAEVAGAGYINVYLDRAGYMLSALRDSETSARMLGGKAIVEHTSVNPNKAAHIGHIRNALLGDTIVRLLRWGGDQVEVQNYIDNTGVQVADVVVGFKYIEGKDLDQVKAIGGKFDYYCWDLYARVGQFYEEDASRLELRARTLQEIESGAAETYPMADYISTRIVNCHLDTMSRLGVEYDLLPRESDVLHAHLWERAFQLLKQRGAIEYESAGKLAGCWVMRSEEKESPAPSSGKKEPEHEADKVIVRSNGTVTYTGKDIAFHLWKLGQVDLDFYYKPFRTYAGGHVAWITSSEREDNVAGHPGFGSGAAYFNVIDIRQSYPQQCVKVGVMAIDDDERVRSSAHLAYERVVLSPAALEQLGQRVPAGASGKGAVDMSGRKGLGVKADDLIDQLEANALAEVMSRHPDIEEADQQATAHKIAVGALRYFLLKYSRTSLIAFDFNEALAFEGETGPYIQYSVVRANSIFRKLQEAGIATNAPAVESVPAERLAELFAGEHGDELWSLLYLATRLPDAARGAINALEPAILAKWTFQLAQSFNLFYHRYHILSEADPARQALLVAITVIVRRELIRALGLLGIEAPERM